MPNPYVQVAFLLAASWALCAFAHPALRRALIDGLRCMGRYPDLWRLPAFFGLAYALFQIAAAALFHWRMAESLLDWLSFVEWQRPPEPSSLMLSSLLPAAERTAAIFTIFTATFPLSAIFALLLLFNYRGMLAEMGTALRKRLGRRRGTLISIVLCLAALGAVAKPVIYLLLPEIAERVPVTLPLALNAVSVAFELLLGIFFLTYLMLMAHAWRRGLYFHRYRLFRLAMRRTGFVLKWSLVITALEVLLVVLPLCLGIFADPGGSFSEACVWLSEKVGRPAVVLVALLFCPVQTILVFHNEPLRQALRDSGRLLRAQWPSILPFLAACYVAFLLLEAVAGYAGSRLGVQTAATLGFRIVTAWLEALLAGWFIASWVCLYKSFSAGRKETLF